MRAILVGTSLASLVLVGCDSGPPPLAEIGTGLDTFEELADEIYLVEGPQGGRHVIGNVRMEGLDPGTTRTDSPAIRFDVFRLDGSRVSSDIPPFSQPFVELDSGGFSLPFGRFVFIDSAADAILDTVVEYRVELVDHDGVKAEDVRQVVMKPYVPL
jgi:hypothetical protein